MADVASPEEIEQFLAQFRAETAARNGAVPLRPAGELTPQQRRYQEVKDRVSRTVPMYQPIDWVEFWAEGGPESDWLIEPLIPAGRQVALYSPAKQGKSLVALDVSAALATGRSVLGLSPKDPVDVLYVDMEMTQDDLRERLEDMGYGAEVDMSHLHYFCLQDFPALDNLEGGVTLAMLAERANAQLVVIDTMSRIVKGDENDADTYRAFYYFTGLQLKIRHIALWRLDHQGKGEAQGQRGSSAKNDDVDVVWRLKSSDGLVTLTRTHGRVSWVPAEVQLRQEQEPLRHVWVEGAYPAGTVEIVRLLDEHGVPEDASLSMAVRMLKEATGKGRRREVIGMAQKYRKRRPTPVPESPEPPPREPRTGTAGTFAKSPGSDSELLQEGGVTPTGNWGGFHVGEPPRPMARPNRSEDTPDYPDRDDEYPDEPDDDYFDDPPF